MEGHTCRNVIIHRCLTRLAALDNPVHKLPNPDLSRPSEYPVAHPDHLTSDRPANILLIPAIP